jgi:hypothetical protein
MEWRSFFIVIRSDAGVTIDRYALVRRMEGRPGGDEGARHRQVGVGVITS